MYAIFTSIFTTFVCCQAAFSAVKLLLHNPNITLSKPTKLQWQNQSFYLKEHRSDFSDLKSFAKWVWFLLRQWYSDYITAVSRQKWLSDIKVKQLKYSKCSIQLNWYWFFFDVATIANRIENLLLTLSTAVHRLLLFLQTGGVIYCRHCTDWGSTS